MVREEVAMYGNQMTDKLNDLMRRSNRLQNGGMGSMQRPQQSMAASGSVPRGVQTGIQDHSRIKRPEQVGGVPFQINAQSREVY